MKIATFDARALRAALNLTARVVERKNTIPVLGLIKIEITDGACTLTATDLDIEVVVPVECDAANDARLLVAPKLLIDFLAGESGVVDLVLSDAGVSFEVSGVRLSLINMFDADDFPVWKAHSDVSALFEVSQPDLVKALACASICISTEETRYYLNGIYFQAIDDKLRMVATDGHRLCQYDVETIVVGELSAIVPQKVTALIGSLISKTGNAPVSVELSRLRGTVKIGGVSIRFRAIDGTYPDYTRVIPKPSDAISVTLNRYQLSKLKLPRGDCSTSVNIQPDAGVMTSKIFGECEVSVPIQGKGASFGFNSRYLRAMSSTSEMIKMTSASAADPCRIATDDPACLFILMPMRVN